MEPRLRAGVVGTGRLGREHARIYRDLPGAELAGVMDVDQACAEQVAGACGTQAFGELDALLERVDLVSVVVPTPQHAEVVERALAAGAHVLVEKPIAASTAEADRMVALARERGRVLGVGHVERYGPAARAFVERCREPRFIECHRLAPFRLRGADVPVVFDLMIHDLDMLLALSPGEVTRVDAIGVPVLTATADIANARIAFSGGLVANVTSSRVSRDRMRKMRAFQRDTYLSLDFIAQRLAVYRRRDPGRPLPADADEADLASLIEFEMVAPAGEEPLHTELASFVEAVRRGGPAPVTGEDGRRALALAERILAEMAH